MKRSFSIFAGLGLSVLLLASCKREADKVADYSLIPESQSFIKVNFASAYVANPGVQIEVNKTRVSNLITARTPFPGGGFNTGGGNYPDYLNVNAGNNQLSIVIPKKGTNIDSVTLFDKAFTFDAGKRYTIHIADTGANTKYMVTTDDLTMPENGKVKYLFVNLMPNVAAVDFYYGTNLIAANVPYMGTSGYLTMQPSLYGTQAWFTRESGTGPSGAILATYSSASTITNQRVYTGFAMGYKLPSTDPRFGTLKPYVSFLFNR